MTTDVTVSLGTFIQAYVLCDKFNLAASDVDSRAKTAIVLAEAVDFIDAVTAKFADGWVMESGSGWIDPELFLDTCRAKEIAQNKTFPSVIDDALDNVDELKTATLKLDDALVDRLETIRKDYSLGTTLEAARLAVVAYAHFKDSAWRGNGFLFTKGADVEAFDSKTYKTQALTPRA